jgi:large subunit ribosomal protein L22
MPAEDTQPQTRANTAKLKEVRIAPRKARAVVELVREKPILEALDMLEFTRKKAAPMVSKLIESALHNVEEADELDWDIDDLIIDEIYVNQGPTLKRFRPRAMGRATPIDKRTSHITVKLQPSQN